MRATDDTLRSDTSPRYVQKGDAVSTVGYDVSVQADAGGVAVDDVRVRPGVYRSFGKAALARTVAFVALLVLSPLVLLVALLVRINLGKGVLYRQVRVGQNG